MIYFTLHYLHYWGSLEPTPWYLWGLSVHRTHEFYIYIYISIYIYTHTHTHTYTRPGYIQKLVHLYYVKYGLMYSTKWLQRNNLNPLFLHLTSVMIKLFFEMPWLILWTKIWQFGNVQIIKYEKFWAWALWLQCSEKLSFHCLNLSYKNLLN